MIADPETPPEIKAIQDMDGGDGFLQVIDSRMSEVPQFGRTSTAASGFGMMCFFMMLVALSAVFIGNRKYKKYLRGEKKKDRSVVVAQGSDGVVVSSSMGPRLTSRKNIH